MARLAARAVEEGSRETLVEAFIASARLGVQAEDYRDGLISMPLPFDAAARLGVDADRYVAEAIDHLDDHEASWLRGFAQRADRDDVAAMGWRIVDVPFGYEFDA